MKKKHNRVRIGKSWFVPILLKVVSTNPDGSPRWLEICKDDEKLNIADGTRQFYLVWGSEGLARRAGQSTENTGTNMPDEAVPHIRRTLLDNQTSRATVTITEDNEPKDGEP